MKFVRIAFGDSQGIVRLSALACAIVKEYYDGLLGAAQNDYMIEKFQSVPAITAQLENGYQYYIIEQDGIPVGFVGFYPTGKGMYLSKFYLDGSVRGQGLGKAALAFIIEKTKAAQMQRIYLNVNKYNESIKAYEKMGFVRIGEEVNDIGNGYVMDDYVYEYAIN